MPYPIHGDEIAADSLASGEGAGRRRFVGGVALTTAALAAGVIRFAPTWDDVPVHLDDAPASPASAEPMALPPPPPPRPVQHGPQTRQEWFAFRQRYVTPEGRVLDTGNGNESHSEGQGWAMMASQACDDPAMFATLLEWTTQNLRCRPYDTLHAWRYRPRDANPVSDMNNATDGDLFIAAALARAAVRWNRPDYAAAAARLSQDILRLVRKAGARTVLLPGAAGFEFADAYTVNPSYYAFALFPDLAALAPSPLWDLLRQDGLALVLQARFGQWMLPPDWVRVGRHDGALSIAMGWPARFSFDAIRVPLHLVWGQLPAAPLFESFRRYWQTPRPMPPAWVDLRTGVVAPYPASPGVESVAKIVTSPDNMGTTVALPHVIGTADYYSAGLVLLSRIAAGERNAAT
jgi:endoglucanase